MRGDGEKKIAKKNCIRNEKSFRFLRKEIEKVAQSNFFLLLVQFPLTFLSLSFIFEMSRARKHVLQEALADEIEPPGPDQCIVRALGARGGNLVEVRLE